MKLSLLLCVLVCSVALSQDSPRLHTIAIGSDHAMHFAADNIVREDGPSSYDSIVHLKGNVEIRTCCVERPTGANKNPGSEYLVMHADEADYDGEKDEIDARGTVHVSFQPVK